MDPYFPSNFRRLVLGGGGIRIVFSDGHDSGLYNWDLIRKLTVGDEAVIA